MERCCWTRGLIFVHVLICVTLFSHLSAASTGQRLLARVPATSKRGHPPLESADSHLAATTSTTATITASNAAPTVSMTAPANGATFGAPANISLAANAADADGVLKRVAFFYTDGTLI